MSMMGESQGSVIKPHEVGSHADANKANNDYANMSNNYTGTYTATANNAYATVALDRNAKVPLDVPYSKSNHQSGEGTEAATFLRGRLEGCSPPIVAPVSSMAAANQPGDLVPALTTALTAALVTLQKPAPDPVPRDSRIKLGRYDGLTSY